MSDPILPLAVWEEGTLQNDVPANDNALRVEAMRRPVLGVENSPPTTDDGDVYIVGLSPSGDFAAFDPDDLTIYRGGNWYAWAPVEGMDINGYVYTGSGGWTASGGGGGSATWGGITGTLSAQSDLQAALNAKQSRAPAIQSVTSSATVTPTFSDDMVKITAQAAGLTLANPTGTSIPGIGMVIRIKDNGTARSINYGSQYRAVGVTLPTTTVINKTLYLAMIFNSDDTKWDVLAVGQEA